MKKLAITVGDPSSVGCEIIKKWIEKNPQLASGTEVIGHRSFLKTLPEFVSKKSVNDTAVFTAGVPEVEGAKVALDALEAAAKGCKDGEYCAVVTAPVSKICMKNVMPDFVGQTEFFESRWGGNAVMCFWGAHMIVSLVTWHIALSKVPSAINFENIARAAKSAEFLARKLCLKSSPKIAMCGLNPHAGEGGILGTEELEIINPAVEILKGEIPNLSLALPPDTVFNRIIKGEFDAAVAMYHDQGLAPLKSVDFDNAVNISMGLNFVRTSPDHGTGFDIAGKGIASEKSFASAVDVALKLIK